MTHPPSTLPRGYDGPTATVRSTWKRPPLLLTNTLWRRLIYTGALVYLVLAVQTVEVDWQRVYLGLERGWRFIEGFLVPDFTTRWRDIHEGLIESLTITLTSTVAGILISVPIGIGAARNLAPAPVYLACRGIITLSRSFQEIIIAILLVAMFGFGPLPGS